MALERIQKILAQAGIASRREAEDLILQKRITINGKVIDTLGSKADPLKDSVKVDGKRITRFQRKLTLLLNKPRNYVSTVEDPQGRPTVMDLCKEVDAKIYPVGRLDFDAEGLLLLTNDGEIANILSHPRFEIPRTYLVKVTGVPDEKDLTRLKRGVMLEDGRARVLSCEVMTQKEKHSWVRVAVSEGRNHLIKRLFSAVGHRVLKLKRVAYGPFELGSLPIGRFRRISGEEEEKIRKLKAETSKFKPKARS